ncbi:undecaprenyl-phosphate glucose phosphotransferase [Stella sp.]|uniref:undecaprenyl-phosphate glucose phosphotransferase n=1 Tax=Stella sp. TaxID=2912054 RepID=UPI0035B3A3AB
MIRWTHGLINRLVTLADGLFLALAILLTALLLGHPTLLQTILLGALGLVIYGQVLSTTGCYRVERYRTVLAQLGDVALGLVPALVAVAVAYHAFLTDPTGGIGWIATLALVSAAVLAAGRLLLVRWGVALADRHAVLRRNVAIVGVRDRVEVALAMVDHETSHLYHVVGIFLDEEDDGPTAIEGVPVVGRVDRLFGFIHHTPIDLVVVALPWESTARINAMIHRLDRLAADVIVPLDRNSFNPRFAQFAMVAGMPSLRVHYQPLKGSLGVLKRIEDIVVSSLALVLTAPVLLAAAIAIKFDSPGPIVFRQQRVGFNNKPFTIYKLRTFSYDPTDDGSLGTKRNDPRVTRIGAILRRLSIDELPQLVNVLKGDMSVVGPRPHVPNMQVSGRQYYDVVREYAARYRVKPGITGWGQINGMRGGIDTVEKASRGVALDLHYIENWSIWFDIRIMILTVVRGLAGRDVF